MLQPFEHKELKFPYLSKEGQGMATKAEAEDVKTYVEDQLVEQVWVKKIFVDKDDVRGYHVAVFVDGNNYSTSGHKIPGLINDVPVMVFMLG